MNLKFFLYLFGILLIVGGLVISMAGLLIGHEEAHKGIFQDYNIDSKIEYHWFQLKGYTIPQNNYENCDSNCRLAHSLNEVVLYHTEGLLIGLWFLFFAYIIFKIMWEEKSNN